MISVSQLGGNLAGRLALGLDQQLGVDGEEDQQHCPEEEKHREGVANCGQDVRGRDGADSSGQPVHGRGGRDVLVGHQFWDVGPHHWADRQGVDYLKDDDEGEGGVDKSHVVVVLVLNHEQDGDDEIVDAQG